MHPMWKIERIERERFHNSFGGFSPRMAGMVVAGAIVARLPVRVCYGG